LPRPSPTVRLTLPLRFKGSAKGRTFTIQAAATDDLGHEDPFALAGTVVVK
jgi:hypothetical protein